jgi:hypothetical protein
MSGSAGFFRTVDRAGAAGTEDAMTMTVAAHDAHASDPASRSALAQERLRPLPGTLTVRDALAHYLAENGFDTKAYTASTYEIEAFGRRYVFKNTPNRKWAIPLHDLHHVATGYGTDLVGEAEVGVWELVGGCRTPIVYALNIAAVLVGVLLAPLRILRAVRDARGARALYRHDTSYEELLALPLSELRRRLGIPSDGVARSPRRLHGER